MDINVIFPIERLQELAAEGVLGGLTGNFFSFIGYNMDPEKFDVMLPTISPKPLLRRNEPTPLCSLPLDRSAISPSD